MSSIIGNFKTQSKVGKFKWENSAEAGALRNKVEKFVAKNPISNQAWHNYAELRALRELARSIETLSSHILLQLETLLPQKRNLHTISSGMSSTIQQTQTVRANSDWLALSSSRFSL